MQLEQLVVEMDDLVERLRSKVAWLDLVSTYVVLILAQTIEACAFWHGALALIDRRSVASQYHLCAV